VRLKVWAWLAGIALLVGVSVAGRSQVVVVEKTSSPGVGGKFAFEILDTTAVQGSARRVGHAIRFTGSIMRHMGTSREIRIVRLDTKMLYLLDPKTKTYSQFKFDELRDQLENAEPSAKTQEPEPSDEEPNQSEYDWEDPTFEARDLHEDAQVNGWKAHHWLLTMQTVGTHRETGIKDTLRFEDDTWLSEVAQAQLSEVQAFNRRWVEALGFEPEQQQLALSFLKAYKKQLEELRREAAKLKGYPVRYRYRLVATNHVAEEQQKKQDAERGSSDQGASGLSSSGLKGALGGFLKKKATEALKARQKKTAKSAEHVVFEMSGNVLSIEKRSLDPTVFQVPESYRLKS